MPRKSLSNSWRKQKIFQLFRNKHQPRRKGHGFRFCCRPVRKTQTLTKAGNTAMKEHKPTAALRFLGLRAHGGLKKCPHPVIQVQNVYCRKPVISSVLVVSMYKKVQTFNKICSSQAVPCISLISDNPRQESPPAILKQNLHGKLLLKHFKNFIENAKTKVQFI